MQREGGVWVGGGKGAVVGLEEAAPWGWHGGMLRVVCTQGEQRMVWLWWL